MLLTQSLQIAILVLLALMFLIPLAFVAWIYYNHRNQKQHSLLRGNHWFLGILRYAFESVGPEFRFYITDDDNGGQPISRVKFVAIVKAAKYLRTLISFGSKRDFSKPGFYLKNAPFPLLGEELRLDNSAILATQRYVTQQENLFFRKETIEKLEVRPWFLAEEDSLVVGEGRREPWRLRGVIGMSGMSYGALGKNALTALSKGIGMAGGSWMTTGEGGLSPYHLAGGCDVVFQIGPGLFGVRTPDGQVDWELIRQKAAIPQVKAFELKLGQGAKLRGGHVEGAKVTPEIAAIRGVPPYKNIDSPSRFPFIRSTGDLFDFVQRIQQESGLPVGIKLVVGDTDALDGLCQEYLRRGGGPDFITVDGGEGGTGATYMEMADSLGLPAYSALVIADNALRRHGIRHQVRLVISGKMHLPDEIAAALSLGADMVNIARGFMIATGCIMAQRCHTNECPVGVATTDPKRERALFVDEKKYRVMNYLIALRAGLFHLAGACGLPHPRLFTREHLVFKNAAMQVHNGRDVFPYPVVEKHGL